MGCIPLLIFFVQIFKDFLDFAAHLRSDNDVLKSVNNCRVLAGLLLFPQGLDLGNSLAPQNLIVFKKRTFLVPVDFNPRFAKKGGGVLFGWQICW